LISWGDLVYVNILIALKAFNIFLIINFVYGRAYNANDFADEIFTVESK